MPIGSIFDAKEQAQTYQPLLLCEFTFKSGNILRVSTHPLTVFYGGVQYGGFDWLPRILNQDIATTQAMSDLGLDVTPQVTVVLADADKTLYAAWEAPEGFKGATLRIYSVMFDDQGSGTAAFSSDSPAPVKFIGICGSASFDQSSMTITATSLLNMSQTQMPPVRVQPTCPWTFPTDESDRSAAIFDQSSIFFRCGYSYGQPGGQGNPETGTAAFVSCNLTFPNCIERLGDSGQVVPIEKDTFGNFTGRFGGSRWIPNQSSGKQRQYTTGQWDEIINASNEAKYGDYVPLCYGTTWVEPLVMGTWGDGNYTNFEVLLCLGEVNKIKKLVVNGVLISRLSDDTDTGHRPSNNSIDSDAFTNDFKNGYWKTVNRGLKNGVPNPNPGWGRQGDPYGSLAVIYVSVLRDVASADATPNIQVLLEAGKIPVFTDETTFTDEFTSNPAWVLLDILTKATWKYGDVNIQSFITAAEKCAAITYFDRMDGVFANYYAESGNPDHHRFEVGFTIRQRTPISEIIRGLRNAMKAMLFFDYATGKLTLTIKETIASQQPNPIVGSNYIDPVPSVTVEGADADGYVAYSFDHSNIIKSDSGESTVKISQKSNQESINKVTVMFQNRENSFSPDSATVVDTEDVSRLGFEVFGSVPVLGANTFDHVRRVISTWFAENYRGNDRLDYRGSAIGDTGGTLIIDFETTIKAAHLMVGQICLFSDAQHGIQNATVRVIRIQPATNFEFAKVTVQWHNDNWYQDTFGTNEQPIYQRAQNLLNRHPYSWRPDYEIPMSGDAYYDQDDRNFAIYPLYSLTADNKAIAQLGIVGKVPVNQFATGLAKPKLEVVGVGGTSGGYEPNTTYYAAVAEKIGTAALSPTSEPAIIKLGNDQNSLQFVAQAWPGQPSGFVTFVGTHPLAMSFQDEFDGTTSVVSLSSPFKTARWEPPDEIFHKFKVTVRRIRHAGVWAEGIPLIYTAPLLGPDFVKISVFFNYGFAPAEWTGRELSVMAISPDADGNPNKIVPIANFPVQGNSADTIVFSAGDATTCVNGESLKSGDIMVMRFKPIYGSDDNGNYFEDSLLVNELNPLYELRLVSSATNTTPIRITLDLTTGESFPFANGDRVVVQYVEGNLNANGAFLISNVDEDTASFDLDGSTGNGDYVKNGVVGFQVRGLNPNDEVGSMVFFIDGTGKGTSAIIKSNTNTRVYINGDWPVTPDETSRLIIVENLPVIEFYSPKINNQVREFVTQQFVEVTNYDKTQLLVHVSTEANGGRQSLLPLDPFREIYLIGNPFTADQQLPGAAPFLVRAEQYGMVTVDKLKLDVNARATKGMNFLLPSIDETDPKLKAKYVSVVGGTFDDVTDPIEISADFTLTQSRFGNEFRVGDFILMNNPYKYEIDLITEVKGNGNLVLSRRGPGAPEGYAQFGSLKYSHTPGVWFFKVIPKIFSQGVVQNTFGTVAPLTESGLPERWEWAYANKLVLAACSQPIGELGPGPVQMVNLAPTSRLERFIPPCPGLRTLAGSAYTNLGIVGDLSVGQTLFRRVRVQAWETIRSVYCWLETAPVGVASLGDFAIVLHVMYVRPALDRAYLIDTLRIAENETTSYSLDNRPDGRQMPYHNIDGGWVLETDWPPNLLPYCPDSWGASGLVLPVIASDNQEDTEVFGPDGFIDAIVEVCGLTTPGANLHLVVQT